MKVMDCLNSDQRQKLASVKKQHNPSHSKERYSRRELEEMMGCNRDTYCRKNGAMRRR